MVGGKDMITKTEGQQNKSHNNVPMFLNCIHERKKKRVRLKNKYSENLYTKFRLTTGKIN